ncbi:MAG: hypothetical protein AAGC74_05320 [Verrucomicrobiota bacterium]
MKTISTLLAATLLMTSSLHSEVQQFNIWLSSNNDAGVPTSYSIPAGKIFIVEEVSFFASSPFPGSTQIRCLRNADNVPVASFFNITIKDSFSNGAVVALENPIRLKAGERLDIPNNGTYTSAVYFGLLIDEADLYAQNIPVELSNPRLNGSQLLADAKFASPRPRITKIESSTNLDTITPDPTGIETPTVEKNTSLVAVDTNSSDKKFLRASAVARPRK